MGCYSWLDCITKEQIRINSNKKAYLLIPNEFGGGSYSSTYDGYGHIAGHDVYEEVAIFNRKYLNPEEVIKPSTSKKFGGLWDFEKDALRKDGKSEAEIEALDQAERMTHYENHLKACERLKQGLTDFINGVSEEKMIQKYGRDYLREIGIDIACYDEDNAKLKYPIKITYDSNAVYEDCTYSLSDPDQGL